MSVPQMFARIFGAVYVLVGILGFVPFLGGSFNQDPSNLLGIFGVTATHNVVHIAIGALFLAGSMTEKSARLTNIAIGATYTLVGIIGLVSIAFIDDLLALNVADNLLHFATGALGLVFGLVAFNKPAGGGSASGGPGYISPDERDRILGLK